jgi:PspAA-like protein
MIVRIMGEGQFRLDDGALERLNELDNATVAAVEAGDEAAFSERYGILLDVIRSEGSPLDGDDLSESDVLFPPADLTFAEAVDGEHFTGDGLIPD